MQTSFGAGDTSLTFISGIGGGGVVVNNAYASFYDTTTQTTIGNENLPMKFNNTDSTSTRNFSIVNDTLGNPTRITPSVSGIFNLQFSAQFNKNAGGPASQIYIWFAIQGSYLTNSNTALTILNSGDFLVASWNYFLPITLGQYAQIFWRATSSSVRLLYDPTPIDGTPGIPSVILTMQKIAELP